MRLLFLGTGTSTGIPTLFCTSSEALRRLLRESSDLQTAQGQHNVGIPVEGIGGVHVPITRDYRVVDLMRDLGLPAVVVTRYPLGTLNHTLLTLDARPASGRPTRGFPARSFGVR